MRYQLHVDRSLSSDAVREYIDRQVGEILPRFDRIVRHIWVHAQDVNGPKGGKDKECALVIQLRTGRLLRYSERSSDLYQATDAVVEKTKARLASIKQRVTGRRQGGAGLRQLVADERQF